MVYWVQDEKGTRGVTAIIKQATTVTKRLTTSRIRKARVWIVVTLSVIVVTPFFIAGTPVVVATPMW